MIRIYILLVLVVLILGYLLLRWYQTNPAEVIRNALKKFAVGLGLLLLILLTLTGKLNWLFAVVGVAIAFFLRVLPVILNYAPQLHRLWSMFTSAKNGQQQSSHRPRNNTISKEEALQILGLKPGASKAEIIDAHRKLIARLHPDKGGSDYLAAQINLAKKVLLQR